VVLVIGVALGPETKGKVLTADLEVIKLDDRGVAAAGIAASDGS
jgi:hypothetical protein